jgi:hypothetical protein
MRCLGIIHVPKSGGSSLRSAVAQLPGGYSGPLYFDEQYFGSFELLQGVPSPNRETIAKPEDLRAIVESHRVVIGHYGALSLMEGGCTDLGIQVREPKARLLSLYRYWQAQPDSVRLSWGLWGQDLVAKADLPLKGFLTSPSVGPAVDNLLVRQALGYRQKDRTVVRNRRNFGGLYTRFKEMPLTVEWTLRSQRFIDRICEQIGASHVPTLRRENATEAIGQDQTIDAGAMRLLNELTRADRLFLGRLSEDGLLVKRSQSDLNSEFEEDALRLGFRLG